MCRLCREKCVNTSLYFKSTGANANRPEAASERHQRSPVVLEIEMSFSKAFFLCKLSYFSIIVQYNICVFLCFMLCLFLHKRWVFAPTPQWNLQCLHLLQVANGIWYVKRESSVVILVLRFTQDVNRDQNNWRWRQYQC